MAFISNSPQLTGSILYKTLSVIGTVLILLGLTACLEQANDLSELDQGLDNLDREITISGPTEIMPGGIYEYTLYDACLFIIPTCSNQDYTVRDLNVTGSSNVSVPSNNAYNGDKFRLQTTGEGTATAHIEVVDNDSNIRTIEHTVTSYNPNRIELDCCRNDSGDAQSVKIPVAQTGSLPVLYYRDSMVLRAPANYTAGVNIPSELMVDSVSGPYVEGYYLINVVAPSSKTRLTLTSDYDPDFMAEVHIYDIYDVDAVKLYTIELSSSSTRVTPRAQIEGIEPRTSLDFDFLYEIQTPDICDFSGGIVEKEALPFATAYQITSGICIVKVTLLGVVASQDPFTVDPQLDPATAPFSTVEIQFN
jgi:hypothetical protein